MPLSADFMSDPGERNWRITIQQVTDDVDASGAPLETWTTLVDSMPAAQINLRGAERFTADQLSARYDSRWQINYREDMDPELYDVAKVRRIQHRGRTYDIVGARMI